MVKMEDFNELLLKLQETHDREMEAWQLKVQELSNKKGCDTKRMEELYNRNQQMKEQQRLLTENIKTLENRLRAGLCDRCTVTQEVAKRRQQEYEASQIQSLQHISLMAGEINNLKKENKTLRDDIRNLRAALDRGQSEHSTQHNSGSTAEVNSSPDLSPSTLPMALISKALRRSGSQAADGDVAVKVEAAQRTEDPRHENRHLREWHKSLFDKPLPASTSPSWKTQHTMPRRSQSGEGLDQQHPNSPSVKSLPYSSPGAEATQSRHILHAPVPCRPQPIKSHPGTLPWPLTESADWASVVGPNLVVQHSTKPNVPRFPNLIPSNQHINHANQRRQVLGPLWHKPNIVQSPNTKESTVVFRLRSAPEQIERQTKPQERKDTPPSKVEKEPLDMNKDVCEGPLDLSDAGRSKPNQRDNSPVALQRGEAEEDSTNGDVKDHSAAVAHVMSPSPVASGSTMTVKQEETASDQNHKLIIKHLKQKDDVNGKPDNGKKVPVLTISLRPVVLESLNSALQKQESSSSNQNSPEAEPASSSEEKDEEGSVSGHEGSQSCKRKRASVETETDRDSDTDSTRPERKVKITLRTEEKVPAKGEESYNGHI